MADGKSKSKTRRTSNGRFAEGVSGNPSGRPKGSRNRTTIEAQELFDRRAGAVTRKAIELAKKGDKTALRLCVQRLIPLCREWSAGLDLEPPRDVEEAKEQIRRIIAAVFEGRIAVSMAKRLTSLVKTQMEVAWKSMPPKREVRRLKYVVPWPPEKFPRGGCAQPTADEENRTA